MCVWGGGCDLQVPQMPVARRELQIAIFLSSGVKETPPSPRPFSKARISVMNRPGKLSSLEFGELIFHSHKSITIITHSQKRGLKLQTLRQAALHYIHTYVVPRGQSAVLCKKRCQFRHRYSHYHLDLPPGETGGRRDHFKMIF